MALVKQLKDIPVGAVGLNLKADPQALPDGALAQAQNAVYTADGVLTTAYGETTTNPSSGTIPYPTAAAVTKEGNIALAGSFGATRNYAALAGGATTAYVYGTTLQPLPAQIGTFPPAPDGSLARHLTYAGLTRNSQIPNGSSKILIAWDYTYNGGVTYYGIWDTATTGWYVVPTQLTNVGTYPMCLPTGHVVSGGYLYTLSSTGIANSGTSLGLTVSGTPTQAYTQSADLANSVFFVCGYTSTNIYRATQGTTSATTIKAAFGAAGVCTIQHDTRNGRIYYADSANIYFISTAGATLSSTATYSNLSGISSGIDGAGNVFVAVYSTPTRAMFTGTFNMPFYILTMYSVSTSGSASQGSVVGTQQFDAPLTIISSVLTSGNSLSIPSLNTLSAVWISYNNTYVCMGSYLNATNTYTFAPIARNQLLASDSTSLPTFPQNVVGYLTGASISSANVYAFVCGSQTNQVVPVSSGTTTTPTQVSPQQLNIAQFTIGPSSLAETPSATITSGMAPAAIMPVSYWEQGFSWTPTPTITRLTGAGNLNGTYSYAFLYEWTDDRNNVCWGRPVFQTVTPVNQVVNFYFGESPFFTSKRTVYVFRTLAGGSNYYAVGYANESFDASTGSWISSLSDNIPDSQLLPASGNVQLYTQATGELPNDPCPPATIVATAASYAVAASSEVPYRLYVSKPFRQGRPVEWNFGMYVDVSPGTGTITGLAVMDQYLLVFKANAVFVLSGASYDITGSNASPSFTTPTQLATFLGCASANSIVVTDQGTFYQSTRGIEIITRGLQQEYIGELLDGQVGTIVSACLVQAAAQVRFLDCSNSRLTTWIYDTVVNRWSTRYSTNYTPGYPAGVIVCVQGSYPQIFLPTQGQFSPQVITESTSAVPQTMTVTTGWIRMQGLQGFARLYRIGVLGSVPQNGTIQAQVAYNYNSTYVDTFTFTNNSAGWNQFRARVSLQKVEAVQVTLTVTSTTAGSVAKLTGVTLEYGVNSGLFRQGASQTIG